MIIHQNYTHNELRNFSYLLELSSQQAIVIDPWDASEVDRQLQERGLKLKAIINTHEHWDHTQGNQALVKSHGCEVWAHQNGEGKIPELTRSLLADELIELDENHRLRVLDTPGHTFAHLCFVIEKQQKPIAVFTGDTLFNAGVGNCGGGGDEATLFETIQQYFQNMDGDVVVYPGHDYLENNLQFTLNFESNNQSATDWLKKISHENYAPGSIQTTIADERTFNTFMRLDNAEIIASLSLKNPEPKAVFIALRQKRNHW